MIDLNDIIAQNIKSIYSPTNELKQEQKIGLIDGSIPEGAVYNTVDVSKNDKNNTTIKSNNTLILTGNNADTLIKDEVSSSALGGGTLDNQGKATAWGNVPEQVPYSKINNTNKNGANNLKQQQIIERQAVPNLNSTSNNNENINLEGQNEKNFSSDDLASREHFLEIGAAYTPTILDQLSSGISNLTAGLFGKNNTYGLEVQNESEIISTKKEFEAKVNVLVNNSKAYLSSSYISNILGAGSALGAVSGIASSLADALNSRQYWTADEFAKITAANFDVLSSSSSDGDMTIKTFSGTSLEGTDFTSFDGATTSLPFKQNENSGKWSVGNLGSVLISDVKLFEQEVKYPIDTELQKMINKLSQKSTSIGYIYVRPISVDNDYQNVFSPFKIPFEFNPIINESSIEARYNAVSLLSRIGDLRAYVGTSPLTVTIKTDYVITTDKDHNINPDYDTGLTISGTAIPATYQKSTTSSSSPGATGSDDHYAKWMDYYTEDIIYALETAYRSLVLPDFSNSKTNNITYVRPPIVKIIMSNKESDANLEGDAFELAYPIFGSDNDRYEINNILASQKKSKFRFHKSFIVTGISINKTFESHNAYYDENGALRFNGFTVEMTLAEITQSYTDVMPDFNIYQNRFSKSVMGGEGSVDLFSRTGR